MHPYLHLFPSKITLDTYFSSLFSASSLEDMYTLLKCSYMRRFEPGTSTKPGDFFKCHNPFQSWQGCPSRVSDTYSKIIITANQQRFFFLITVFVNEHYGTRSGFYLSASCVALGSCVFFFIDAHKKSVALRRKMHVSSTEEEHNQSNEDLHQLSVHEDALALAIDNHEQRLMYLKSIAAATRLRNNDGSGITSGRLSPFAAKADCMRKKSSFELATNTLVLPPAELTCISEEEAILENFLEDCVWKSGQMSQNKREGNFSQNDRDGEEEEEEEEEGTKGESVSTSFASERMKCHGSGSRGEKRRRRSFEDVSLSLRDSDDDCLINSIKRKVLEDNAMKGEEEIVEQCPCCKRCIIECDVQLSEDIYERAPVIFEQSSTDEDEEKQDKPTRKMTRVPSIESNSDSNECDDGDGNFNGQNIVLNENQIKESEKLSV